MAKTSNYIPMDSPIDRMNPMVKIYAIFCLGLSALIYPGFILGYVIVALLYMIKAGLFKKTWGVILTWLVVTFSSVVISSCITIFVFGGATGATGTSVLTAGLIAATKDIVKSVFASSMIENLADRAIAFAIAYVLLKRIPKRFLSQYAVDSADEDEDDD